MPELTPEQKEALKDEKRSAIHTFLKEQKKPASLGEISRGIDLRDLAKVSYHLNKLAEVDVVEMVPGTRRYRLVGGE
jgi:SOS-response transcriptional repressor LexA